jgi:hypothetical protein
MLSSCVSCPDDSRPERRFIRCLPKETHRVSKETHTVSEQTRRFIRCLCVCLCVFVCVCVCVSLHPLPSAHPTQHMSARSACAEAEKHVRASIAAPQVHALLPLRCTHCCPSGARIAAPAPRGQCCPSDARHMSRDGRQQHARGKRGGRREKQTWWRQYRE